MLLEKTQRRLCRALFVLGCVLPTLAVAGLVVDRWSPAYEAEVLAAAGAAVDARLECDRLTTPRPGVVELHGVRLATPTTGQPLATCDKALAERTADGWRLLVDAARVADGPLAARWLQELVQGPLRVEARCRSLSINGAESLADVRFDLGGKPARRLKVAAEGASLVVSHDGGRWSARGVTGDWAIPSAWLPGDPLGFADAAASRFTGECRAVWSPSEPAPLCEASGALRLETIDLGGVSAERGAARLDELRWQGGRIERLAGRIDLRQGLLTREIAYGLHQAMGVTFFDEMYRRYHDPHYEAGTPFSQLACEVELDAEGLTLVAGCGEIDGQFRGGEVGHAIAEHEGVALLKEPLDRPLPPHTLVRAWRPLDAAELPASEAAIRAASRLPTTTLK